MSTSADHPLLEARHVDDLTGAVRSLTLQLVAAGAREQRSLDAQHRQLELMRESNELMRGIAESVDALREVIVKQKTNGNAHAHAHAHAHDDAR
jgi:hypothetical protein